MIDYYTALAHPFLLLLAWLLVHGAAFMLGAALVFAVEETARNREITRLGREWRESCERIANQRDQARREFRELLMRRVEGQHKMSKAKARRSGTRGK